MIGFQEIMPVAIIGGLAWFLGPKVWGGLKRGGLQAARDAKEFGSELSNVMNEDTKPKEDIKDDVKDLKDKPEVDKSKSKT